MCRKTVKTIAAIWALIIIVVALFLASVKAMDLREINKNIYLAEISFSIAREHLAKKDVCLLRIYEENPFSQDGHSAELHLREKYPAEYFKYIKAKMELDDLRYTRFLAITNSLDNDKEV